MTTLPTDLIAEILSFLPPTSLCRFKSVAKSWQYLITSDAFIKLHLTKTLICQPPNLIICHDSLSSAAISAENPNEINFSAVDHPVKHLPHHPTVELIGCCLGVLCISDQSKETVFYFNPSTKTHRLIPPAPMKIPAVHYFIDYGFGYDSSVDDYKLLRIIECYDDYRVRICGEVMLYSMRSNSWKIVRDDFDDYSVEQMDAVHVNGVLYFAVSDKPFVKCFDLKTEKFSVFDMVEYDKSFKRFAYMLVELGGCLALMANYSNTHLSKQCGWKLACAELWVRKEVSWVSDPFMFGSLIRIRPVTYSKDGGRVLFELDGTKFCWFDWRSNKFTKVWARGIQSEDKPFDAFTFVPNIVSLRSDEDKAKDERKVKGKVVPQKNEKLGRFSLDWSQAETMTDMITVLARANNFTLAHLFLICSVLCYSQLPRPRELLRMMHPYRITVYTRTIIFIRLNLAKQKIDEII